MFDWFKKRRYDTLILPHLSGEASGVAITFWNYPIRESADADKIRKEVVSDFNVALLDGLFQKIGNIDQFLTTTRLNPATYDLEVGIYRLRCEIRVNGPMSEREFSSQLPDAIIDAFKKEKIGR